MKRINDLVHYKIPYMIQYQYAPIYVLKMLLKVVTFGFHFNQRGYLILRLQPKILFITVLQASV